MLLSRAPRNRYRRRPSRLTALGKAVVASTVTAFLAIGWASQASRRSDEASEPVDRPVEQPLTHPVSAPPRWPAAPSFGVFGAPGQKAVSEPASEAPEEPGAAAAPTAIGTRALDELELSAPPTSRARFEQARPGAVSARALSPTSLASTDPSAAPAATDPGSAYEPVANESGRTLVEWVDASELGLAGSASGGLATDGANAGAGSGRVRVEYSLDEALTERVFEILRHGRVERGIAIVIDPRSGRVLAYASTNSNVLPVEGIYPAASIIKVVTAAAMLEQRPNPQAWDCLYEGNKYRLSQRRLDPPKRGNHSTLEEAMASSNNQCFSQWAIHGLGEPRLRRMLDLVGWTTTPALGHAAGQVEPAATRYDLGQLGSGLDGVRVTPLHVASLASILTDGRLVAPRWIDRVIDGEGRAVALPAKETPRRVISQETAEQLRELMVATTRRGTARRAFRTRRGFPVLGSIEVAGKTGNLNGSDPKGRYEWFFGVAPAKDPTIGVVVMQVHDHLWWARSSELAANILRTVFCEGSACRAELSARYTGSPSGSHARMLVSDLDRTARASSAD